MGIPVLVINLGKFVVQSACRAIPRWWKPLLIHDKLSLCKCKVKITHISSNPRFNSVVRCNLNRLQKQIFELKQCHQRTMEYWQRQKAKYFFIKYMQFIKFMKQQVHHTFYREPLRHQGIFCLPLIVQILLQRILMVIQEHNRRLF